MDGYRKSMLGAAKQKIKEGTAGVERARLALEQAESALAKYREHAASVDAFLSALRPALEMPKQGELFVNPANQCPNCIVDDPAFGYGIRFTAAHKGQWRTVKGRAELEFVAGDLLEYLGSGAIPKLAPGDRITIISEWIHNGTILRRAVEPHEENDYEPGLDIDPRILACGRTPGRISHICSFCHDTFRDWPTISGTVVSVEPRCTAYTRLPDDVRTLEQAKAARCSLDYFTLRQIFLPVEVSAKAAAKKK